jgi:hypothetical protein
MLRVVVLHHISAASFVAAPLAEPAIKLIISPVVDREFRGQMSLILHVVSS